MVSYGYLWYDSHCLAIEIKIFIGLISSNVTINYKTDELNYLSPGLNVLNRTVMAFVTFGRGFTQTIKSRH